MSIIYEYQRYVATPETLKKVLEKYGVAIIPSVLTDAECEEMNQGMWDTLAHLTQDFDRNATPGPIDSQDTTTWRSLYELFPLHSMLLQHWKIGHAQYIWRLREHPAILNIWSKFWGIPPEELLVSFDGVSYHLPPEVTRRGWFMPKSDKGWLHTDQSYLRNNFECVQSWVTARDVRDGDATLAILEGSHLHHAAFAKHFNITDPSDWNRLKDREQLEFYMSRDCKRRSVKCPKGSIVFWDSRTLHSGQEPLKNRKTWNIRNIAYLCYTPRSLATPSNLKKKVKYLEDLRMTTHWPHKIKVFAKIPRTYDSPLPLIRDLPAPNLSRIGKILAGYDPIKISEENLDEEGYAIIDLIY